MSIVSATVGDVLLGIQAGKSVKTKERPAQPGELGILKVSAVTWGEFRPGENKAVLDDYAPGDCPRPRAGDLLISRANTRDLVAAPVLVENDHPNLLLSDKILRLIPDERRVERRYLFRALRSAASRKHFESRAGGTSGSMTNITQDDICSAPLLLPPLTEQRRIADILDKADAVRRKRKEAIALTEVLLRSTFLEMFGDPVTNPKGWPTESIDSLCSRGADLVDGPFGSSLKPEHYVASGVRVVRNWNIYDDLFDFTEFKYVSPAKFDEIRRSEVRAGDVLITTKGTVGDVCVAPDLGGAAVLSASGTVRLRLPPDESYLPEFVVGQMTSRTYKSYLHTFEAGSAQQYLNLSAIRKMRLIRPPVKKQAAFRTFRSRVQDSQRVVRAAHEGAEILFNSLVARAFAGSLEATAC